MKISVVIPTLTEATTISGMLDQFGDSARRRELDLEVIVSDGGSKDDTAAVAQRLADKVVVWDTAKGRQTIGLGRNMGAAEAIGDIIVFLDSDVRIGDAATFFGIVRQTFADPKIVASNCSVLIYPQDQTLFDAIFHRSFSFILWALNSVGYGTSRGECQMVRRVNFEQLGGYNGKMPTSEDFDLFHRLSKIGKIKYLLGTKVYESPRRYRKYGYPKLLLLWVSNWLGAIFHRSNTAEWEEVR
ncbi:glycosyltransferase [Candidatus Saccharibacteria bacterium]|nr:glycosyltransferase [Candidatus Saccharibacteria bacterium]